MNDEFSESGWKPPGELSSRQRLAALNLAQDAEHARTRAEESEQRLSLALGASGGGSWEWSPDDNRVSWDKQIASFLGMLPGDIQNDVEQFLNHICEHHRTKVRRAFLSALVGSKPLNTEFQFNRADGTTRVIAICGKSMSFRVDRKIITGVAWDITARKKSEELLRASRERLAGVVDASTELSFVSTDVSGTIQTFNVGAERMLGYSADELVGKKSPAIFHDQAEVQIRSQELSAKLQEDVNGFEVFVALPKRGHADRREWTYIHKDGTRFPVNLVVTAIRDSSGMITGFLGVAENISERKRQEQKFRATIEAAPTAIVVLDDHYRILLVNNQAENMFGCTRESVLQSDVRDLILPESHEDFSACYTRALEPQSDSELRGETEISGIRKDGNSFPIQVGMRAVASQDVRLVICGIVDITDQVAALAALVEAKESAESASKAKSSFLANMSHEIRTPMNGIIGMAQLLNQTLLNTTQTNYVETLLESADALLRILNDILDFSKIEAGKLQIEAEDFDFQECVARATQLLALKAEEKSLQFSCRVDPEIPRRLIGDPGRLRQIFVNLVSNAIKFTETGSVHVDVSKVHLGNATVKVDFAVRDTGIGLNKSRIDAIFQPFHQAESSTTRRYGGTGLGLAICKQLSDMMDGELGVESEEGIGSTFHFLVELKIAGDAMQVRLADSIHENCNVLVVDDDRTNRMIVCEQAKYWGMTPWEADSAAAAREILNSNHESIHLILLDYHMPEEDGLTFAKSLAEKHATANVRDRRKSIPILLLSSSSNPLDVAERDYLNIYATLAKPIVFSTLEKTIAEIFGSPQESSSKQRVEDEKRTAHNLRVLVAEDNPVNRQVATGLLENFGHRVSVAQNGEVACDLHENEHFDLVLMDMQMPVMDGYAAIATIRERENSQTRIPIIAVTADAMKGDREKCLAVGADEYVAKPIDPVELRQKIEALAGSEVHDVDSGALGESMAENLAPGINLALAMKRIPGGMPGVLELCHVALDDCPRLIEEIREGRDSGDRTAVSRAAHSLKSCASYFGAEQMHRSAFDLELLARSEGEQSDLTEAIANLTRESKQFLHSLEELIQSHA